MAAGTATTSRGLNAQERAALDGLLAKAGLAATAKPTGVRTGSTYQALINLSLPRGPLSEQNDLVPVGETVILTDEEAAPWLPPNKPFPFIRLVSETSEPFVPIPPRAASGPRRGPGAGARPDPAGSTLIQVAVPEDTPPQLNAQNTPGLDDGDDVTRSDAADIPVRR